MAENKSQDRLRKWQTWMERNEADWEAERVRMDKREQLYLGNRTLKPLTDNDRKKDGSYRKTSHVWNIIAENIESMIDSTIPAPKVTARREKDAHLAQVIEAMLKNELDRLPMEELNDMQERTVPIQGGGLFLVEWDNNQRTSHTIGETLVSVQHPKKFIPQSGVFTGLDDMDAFGMKLAQTKGFIKKRYGMDVSDEREEDPSLRGAGGVSTAEDMVTQYVVYYRNGNGGIGMFSWVGDTVLVDLEDYQARRLRHCVKCGTPEPVDLEVLDLPTWDGTPPSEGHRAKQGVCPNCGCKVFEEQQEKTEMLLLPAPDGYIPTGGEDVVMESDEMGNPMYYTMQEVPIYKPDVFPLVLQKNVSVFGKLLGDSDVDKIEDQQNTVNRMEQKIIERLVRAGSVITKPATTHMPTSSDDSQEWVLSNAAEKQMIDVYTFSGNLEYEMAYLSQVYEEARRVLGITDSYQGRKDTTATSGKAKEFSAAQAAGRMESKRVMKNAAYARLFEILFKFKLAYCDEPRDIVRTGANGENIYDQFNRLDFLERDEDGNWHWIDDFLFSTDTAATLSQNRQAMWQETTSNLQSGAFGDPTQLQTLILYWSKMERLGYPDAGSTRKYLEEQLEQQKVIQQMQAQNGPIPGQMV
nr:MAG TPA: Portal protein [Bacteriophage sp.]